MKRFVFALVILNVVLPATSAAVATPQSVEVTRNIASMPLAFTANQGQWDQQVMFRTDAGGATMWFTSSGATYQFTRAIGTKINAPYSILDRRYGMNTGGRQTSRSSPNATGTGAPRLALGPDSLNREPDSFESIAIKASFIGANQDVPIKGTDAIEYKCNYFIGNDPNEWYTDVPNYSAVVYEQVYDGIDLKYYGNGRQMEYDFIVSPGADFSQIKIQYEGAKSISINDNGELVVETKWGEVVEQKPVIYQTVNSAHTPIEGKYVLKGARAFGFELGNNYDPALPLVIDPVLSFSTYLGGSEIEYGIDIAVDDSGNVLVTGGTRSDNFPTTGLQFPHYGNEDVFVTKLNSLGNALVYSTYFGGSSVEAGVNIATDNFGAVYVTGYTYSTDFPTVGAFQATHNGFSSDGFVTKLSGSGSTMIYSSYLGGSSIESSIGLAVDDLGNAYVAGWTSSYDFPTEGAFQTYVGADDAFVTKINSSGSALVYSTYLGGLSTDFCTDLVLDSLGNVYVTGNTYSTDFPTAGAYQTDQGDMDAFVTKIDSSGSALVYSTYLGGSGKDGGHDITLDGSGSIYITGHTLSTDFPTTAGAYQTDQGDWDAFVTKLNPAGNSLVYSTYLGGNGFDEGVGITVDGSGSTYIAGWTRSPDFPAVGAYQTYQGDLDVFLTKLNWAGNALLYSTHLGGTGYDEVWGSAIDASGAVYVTGSTGSPDFPVMNPYQGTYQGGAYDVFVTKFSGCCVGVRGDVSGDGNDLDIVDLVTLIDFLFGVTPPIPCPEESDVNGDGSGLPDIIDLTFIVDWLFGVAPTLVPCP